MVSVGTTLGNDSRWTKLLSIGPIRCVGNVSVLVTNAGFTELTGTINVSVLRVIPECISFVLAKQSKLRRRIPGWCLSRLLSNES